ncbi:MAG: ABC transporter ATP-binding protein/permease [Actinomycetota bacterium]|nr:ABC transporter ATP-binding protein/permease [Actinomycetota bacterium]
MRFRRTTGSASADSGATGCARRVESSAPPLIGVDDLKIPPWAQVMETVAGTGIGRTLRAAPAALRVLVRLAWHTSPRLTLLAAVVELLAGCATAFGLLATATVLTELLAQGPTPQRVVAALPALVLVMASFAARGLLDAAVGAVQAVLAPRVELRAQDELHAAVIGVELIAFDDPDFVELVRRTSMQGIRSVRYGVGDVGNLLSSTVSLAAAIVTAGLLNPVLAPVVLLAAVPNGWANVRAALLSYESYVRTVSRMRRLGITGDIITGRREAAEVRAFTTQDTLLGEHRRIGSQLTAEAVAVEHHKTAIRLFGRGLAGIGTALAYGVLGVLLYTGAMPLALAGAAAVAMRTASSAVSTTVFAANRLFEHSFYLDLLTACLTQARSYHRAAAVRRLPGDPRVIELHQVSFSYPGKEEPALHQVSLTIRRGQVVALVGENGSGKSTLAKVITGLYLPDQGRVTWDGVDIATVDPCELHSQVGVVLQDPVQWPTTAANNVRIGRLERPDPGGRTLAAAAADSGADAVVAGLPGGWNSVLSREFQNGCDLSGGQWQRISVARGLYRDAPLLIADEPTAAMDARAEQAVFQSLRPRRHAGAPADNGDSAAVTRTTVLITHRLANIRHADQIIVLDHGRITEQGTHGELMARGGGYAELFALQAQAYLGGAEELSPLG